MSHAHRLRTTDRIFFVSINVRRCVQVFREGGYPLLIEAVEAPRRRRGFLLCGNVLMPDHWHALIWTGYPLTISQVIHDIKVGSARRLHERRGSEGALWQHQFWDRFVRHPKEFRERLEYMHLNPVRKGLASRPEEWRWSSYNNFALDRAPWKAARYKLTMFNCVRNTGAERPLKAHGQKNPDRGPLSIIARARIWRTEKPQSPNTRDSALP